MKPTTLELIKTVLNGDDTLSPAEVDNIIRKLGRKESTKRNLIQAKEAMTILNVSRPTLLNWVKEGKLTQINFSCRRVRFDADEVRALANNGV